MINNRGFTSAIKLREISTDPGDGFGSTYVSPKSNHKRNSELINLLEKVLFSLTGCLTQVDRLFKLWNEKFCSKKYLKRCHPNIRSILDIQ